MGAILDIIVVNWNAGVQLRNCLESIVAAHKDGFELGRVTVVDNASTDGSTEKLGQLGLPLTGLCSLEITARLASVVSSWQTKKAESIRAVLAFPPLTRLVFAAARGSRTEMTETLKGYVRLCMTTARR